MTLPDRQTSRINTRHLETIYKLITLPIQYFIYKITIFIYLHIL